MSQVPSAEQALALVAVAAVVAVVAVVALPLRVAVMTPAEKLPEASRFTMLLATLVLVACVHVGAAAPAPVST